FPDASFDRVVVSIPADASVWGEVARVLVPGGKVLVFQAGAAESAAGPLKVTEAVYARRAGHGWALGPAAASDTEVTLWVAEKA
ncbi:MAG: hypothetical protein ACRC7O_18430, partial [Fimbriiglobus sp.]